MSINPKQVPGQVIRPSSVTALPLTESPLPQVVLDQKPTPLVISKKIISPLPRPMQVIQPTVIAPESKVAVQQAPPEPKPEIQQATEVEEPPLSPSPRSPSSSAAGDIPFNPLTNIITGCKRLMDVNYMAIIVCCVSTLVISLLVGAAFVYVIQLKLEDATSLIGPGGKPTTVFVGLVVLIFVYVLIFSVFYTFALLSIYRLLLAGVRGRKVTIFQGFVVGLNRYWLMFKLFLLYLLMAFGPQILVLVLGKISIGLSILASLVFVLALIVITFVYLPTLSLLIFTVIDDKKPFGPADALKRSRRISRKVSGQIWTHLITWGLVTLVISLLAFSSTFKAPPAVPVGTYGSYTVNTNPTYVVSYSPKTFIGNLLILIVSAGFIVGLAEIYQRATKDAGINEAAKYIPTIIKSGVPTLPRS